MNQSHFMYVRDNRADGPLTLAGKRSRRKTRNSHMENVNKINPNRYSMNVNFDLVPVSLAAKGTSKTYYTAYHWFLSIWMKVRFSYLPMARPSYTIGMRYGEF